MNLLDEGRRGSATPSAPTPALPDYPPRPRLSFARVLLALILIAAIAGSAAYAIKRRTASAPSLGAARFAPYDDVTLTPSYAFQDPAANPVQRVILGFIVADPSQACAPSWGGYYTPAQAATALNLDRRVRQVQAQGGLAAISFGGAANTELAVSCSNTKALAGAYQSVLERYKVYDVDFDIEGDALVNAAANTRRAQAIALVARDVAAAGGRLRVWLTLPVAPTGFTSAGIAAIRSMLAARVPLTGVNVLAMDYAPTRAVRKNMIQTVEGSLTRAHSQLEALDAQARLDSRSGAVWGQLGVTVMIGRNDPAGEVFSLADAHTLASFVTANGVAQVSTWSLNRDSECGSVFPELGVLSNVCSGVKQAPLAFTGIFRNLPGTVTARDQSPAPLAPATVAPDDPATSPYPIWRADRAYPSGYKVVWHHTVYEALWYSQGQAPDTPVSAQSPSPWLLLGPVLTGEFPPKPHLLDAGIHAKWSPTAIYRAGSRVTYDGLPFEAKWYSQGTVPDATLPVSPQDAWLPLYTVAGEPAS